MRATLALSHNRTPRPTLAQLYQTIKTAEAIKTAVVTASDALVRHARQSADCSSEWYGSAVWRY
jgi:hypothetical protein